MCIRDSHSSTFGLCARCSRGGQLVLAGGGVAAIHFCLPGDVYKRQHIYSILKEEVLANLKR